MVAIDSDLNRITDDQSLPDVARTSPNSSAASGVYQIGHLHVNRAERNCVPFTTASSVPISINLPVL